jgi:hypothetical protein
MSQEQMPVLSTRVRVVGTVDAVIEYADGRPTETVHFGNALLRRGREALAKTIANEFTGDFEFYVNRMLFGDGGTTAGVPKYVNIERNGLFGTTRAAKPVIATVDPNNPNQVTFTSVVTYTEANGFTLNEMALQMANGDLYSMATFPGIGKTSIMQVTWLWRVAFV